MTYHPLTNETGGSAYDAIVEKQKLIKIIRDCCDIDRMTPTEQGFIERVDNNDDYISPKQLLWLRDIKDKYLL
jgi:hypothetical protein